MHTYTPLGPRVFLRAAVPEARIAPRDVLSVFPAGDGICPPSAAAAASAASAGVLELPPQAYAEFVELSTRMQDRYERLFCQMTEVRGR